MQITENGLATATNVENNTSSSFIKDSGVVKESSTLHDTNMEQSPASTSGANEDSNLVATDEGTSTVDKPDEGETPKNDIKLDEINENFVKNLFAFDNIVDDEVDNNNSTVTILDQADTTSVENLSIVTVVEKEFEGSLATTNKSSNIENVNGLGKICIGDKFTVLMSKLLFHSNIHFILIFVKKLFYLNY